MLKIHIFKTYICVYIKHILKVLDILHFKHTIVYVYITLYTCNTYMCLFCIICSLMHHEIIQAVTSNPRNSGY